MEARQTIVIGAGIGGLATAALLADSGRDVLVLEAHSATGGCAGYFDRYEKLPDGPPRRFRFDVGATTLSGVADGQPLNAMFKRLGSAPPMRRIDPGMICHLVDGTTVIRYSDRHQWIQECQNKFGQEGQESFWNELFSLSDKAWKLSTTSSAFPPKSIGDVLHLATPGHLLSLPLLRYTWSPVADLMRHHGLGSDVRFRHFIDEQLMITAQNTADETPLLVGAMGLSYPGDTWYLDGGMYALAEYLEHEIVRRGGEIRTKRYVTSIRREGHQWYVETSRGEHYLAETLIANATIFDLAYLVEGDDAEYFRRISTKAGKGWGAFTLYCAVRDEFDDHGTLYHQIHTDSLPVDGAGSIFLSLSHADDALRAPEGWRVLTVSTHVADPKWWTKRGSLEIITAKRAAMEQSMLNAIGGVLPGFASAERKFVLTGTPKTFEHYTHRRHGMVGGVPHSIHHTMILAPKYRTPADNFHIVGDTVYPGQGTPAVVLGALNLVQDIT